MTPNGEWDRWEARWRSPGAPGDLDAMIDGARRMRRSTGRIRLASAAMALFAIAVVFAALRHAGNVFEMSLGLVVAVAIAVMWIADVTNDRRSAAALQAPQDEYFAVRRSLCARRIRFAHLGWVLVALDLVFLVPWWFGGFQVHGYGFHLAQILTIWTPLGVMATFVGWTVRMRTRARAELRQLTGPRGRAPSFG